MDTQIISIIVGIFLGLGTLIAGIGYAYAQFKRGGDQADDRLISSQKEYIAVLEEKNKKLSEEKNQLIISHQAQLTDLNKAMGVLQGRLDEQTKVMNEYKAILQGRDPEHANMLKETKQLLTDLKKILIK